MKISKELKAEQRKLNNMFKNKESKEAIQKQSEIVDELILQSYKQSA